MYHLKEEQGYSFNAQSLSRIATLKTKDRVQVIQIIETLYKFLGVDLIVGIETCFYSLGKMINTAYIYIYQYAYIYTIYIPYICRYCSHKKFKNSLYANKDFALLNS